MNYYNFVKQIKEISLANGIVNETGEGDIYLHLNSGMHKYPCVFLTVQNITFANDIVNVNGTLFYVDRLLDNSANKVEIQSNALTVLSQIFDRIAEETDINIRQNTYTPFDEKFADLCAGQFATFQASFPNDVICSDDNFEIKTITLNHNGIYDIIGYDQAVVAVEGGKWGQIKGDINDLTDLIELVDGAVGDSCECVQEAKTEILDAIGKIDIDTTELAKQGTDSNANITDITEKLQTILDANILRPNLQGITFADGYATDNVADIVCEWRKYIKKIASDNVTIILPSTFNGNTVLEEIDFPNVTSIGNYGFNNCNNLREANFPNVTSIGEYGFNNCNSLREANFPSVITIGTRPFNECGSLIKLYLPNVTSVGTHLCYNNVSLQEASLPKLTNLTLFSFTNNVSLKKLNILQVGTFGNNVFVNDTNLIDITLGANIKSNINFNTIQWNPTNAYSATSNTLVPAEVLEEHPTWKNRDYLRYCLREHFAANLEDRSTASTHYTLTFNTTMKNNVIANDEATLHAFTDKGWIVA